MIPLGDLKRQHLSLKDEINQAVNRVLDRGWFVLGSELDRFEQEFAKYCGKKYGIGAGNGTDALFLALKALDIRQEDEVITVANTAIPTVSAIVASGAKPVLVDVGEDYLIDIKKIQEKITEKTKVIMPVHLYGQACDMDPILDIAQRYGIKVIEDCAQAHGAEYKRKKVPIGKIGCFSFYPSKNLGADGDAGMIVTDDKELEERLRLLKDYGQSGTYISEIDGYNSRLDEIQAAILHVKLKYLDKWNNRRREIAAFYDKLLQNCIKPKENQNKKHVYHLYIIRHEKRDKLMDYLKEKEILTKIHYPVPIHLQPSYKKLGYKECDFPVAEKFSKEILSLPMFPELTEEEVKMICKAINEFGD